MPQAPPAPMIAFRMDRAVVDTLHKADLPSLGQPVRFAVNLMNPLKLATATETVSSPQEATEPLLYRVVRHSYAPTATMRDTRDQTRSTRILLGLQALANSQKFRVAIRAKGKISFVNLLEVASVQADGKHVWLQGIASSYLLRASISIVAEMLKGYGFIRIHRSVLVNTSCVEELRPLSTGEYCLRIEGGKEFTVTRTYKKNLKALAELWIGTGAFPS
jgi:DNA-binding LytR/AlgR family response regulator